MRIGELISEYAEHPYGQLEVYLITHDSREVQPGALFFCLTGREQDGNRFIADAENRGAAAVVTDRMDTTARVPVIRVDSARMALSAAAAKFFGEPAKRLTTIGVTGTNGKTTTTYIIKSILEAAGHTVGLIGTNAVMIGGETTAAKLTTPDPVDLNAYLCEMEKSGVTHVVMEVSAHALALYKTDGFVYDIAAFTNLTQDHLDFFHSMTTYKRAKMRLFTEGLARQAVINTDDKIGREIAALTTLPKLTYGCDSPCDVFGVQLTLSEYGIEFVINMLDDIQKIRFALPGRFNMYNVLCAAAVCKLLGVSGAVIKEGVRNLKKVAGRFDIVNTAKASIIIDYAHTDDGLRNILASVREFARGRVITVFGCGGDRDREKRPLMGRAAAELSDIAIVTSDNPRSEDPERIIDDVLCGIGGHCRTVREPDRRRAIRTAMELAEEGDLIVVAGKGAERYQEIDGKKEPYNDEEFIKELLKENDL